MNNQNIRSQRGFSMVELLTVLVIIGVLLTISMVAYNSALERSRLARVKTNMGEISLSLDDFARDHNAKFPALVDYHNVDPVNIDTVPDPPVPPTVIKRRGNAIIGGSPALADTGNPLQDDFYQDSNPATVSYFRDRDGELPWDGTTANWVGPMRPVDVLVRNGHFDAYPLNPLAGPGIPMVNIAHFLLDYDTQTNDIQWVQMDVQNPPDTRIGLTAARPGPEGRYVAIPEIWTEETYPQGDFAYIPFDYSNTQGSYCNGYWLICYGDLTTLNNSPYNKYSVNKDGVDFNPTYANWPNFPPPYGDGDPSTPPQGVEYEIKRLLHGALEVQATIFDDQFKVIEQ